MIDFLMMTVYDDTMRTIIEIPKKKVMALDMVCRSEKISRAELVRRAIDKYLLDMPQTRRKAGFGLWKSKKIDSLKYEKTLRDEWT
jgi:hypothetical protein